MLMLGKKHSKPVCRHSAAATCLQQRLLTSQESLQIISDLRWDPVRNPLIRDLQGGITIGKSVSRKVKRNSQKIRMKLTVR